MLATSNFNSSPPQAAHNFLPHVPSPLSPRRNTIHLRQCMSSPIHHSSSMSISHQEPHNLSPTSQTTPFSSRPIKQVPIRQDALRDRRRDMFLRKVRQSRDDAKWDSRLDDMARLDFLTSQRKWERQQSLSAPPLSPDLSDAEASNLSINHRTLSDQMSMDTTPRPPTPSEEEVEALLKREREEMDALLALMKEDEQDIHNQHHVQVGDQGDVMLGKSSVFGGDDDEYDSIFMDMIDESGGHVVGSVEQDQQQGHAQAVNDEMDLS